MAQLNLSQAATDAGQQNLARKNVTDTAYARKQSALGLGKGLDTTASSALSSSANTNLSLANASQAQANRQASALGNVADKVFSSGAIQNWLGNSSVQAGSSNGNGSVQGNSDYVYDL